MHKIAVEKIKDKWYKARLYKDNDIIDTFSIYTQLIRGLQEAMQERRVDGKELRVAILGDGCQWTYDDICGVAKLEL